MLISIRLQGLYQAQAESYNGAQRDDYSWSQSITDVDLRIKVREMAWNSALSGC